MSGESQRIEENVTHFFQSMLTAMEPTLQNIETHLSDGPFLYYAIPMQQFHKPS